MTIASPQPPEGPPGPFDADDPPPMNFDAWAELSAHLLQRTLDEQAKLFDSRELDIDLWDACNVFWLQELTDQIQRGNTKLAMRYGALCAKELQTRSHPVPAEIEPDPDATAFMTALHDETALPFASPVASAARPFEKTQSDADGDQNPLAETGEADPNIGETLEVHSIDIPEALPFDNEKPDEP